MKNQDQPPKPAILNGFYERLLVLRRTNPKAFESISPASKLALAQYEQAKRAHQQAEEIRREMDDLPPAA